MTKVAILVPGIMGSRLELNGELIWPGSLLSLIGPYKKMDKLLAPDLDFPDVIRDFSISEQYDAIIDDLARCGFRESDNPPTMYVCPYDWRKDNAESAETLAAKISEVAAAHGGPANCEISIIAHSMGGLIGRYYLESGKFKDRSGFGSVKRLLTLGTPHRGAPLALLAALGMEKRLFLSAEQVHRLVSDTRFPALYQLMPPPGEPFVWNEDRSSEYSAMDVYEPPLITALGLIEENLEKARKFHAKLDMTKRPDYDGKPVRYFFFVGTRQKTVSGVSLLPPIGGGKYRARRMELEDAGDGTVPIWSGSITGVQGQPVGGEHSTIYKNDLLRRTMGILLGSPGILAAPVRTMQRVEVALRERVVNPGDPVNVTLTFGAGVDKLNGRLDVQRALIDEQNTVAGYANPVSSHSISYAGLNAEKLSVILNAPAVPGVYRVAYTPSGAEESAGKDDLFVQEST
jgi:pimeloyl-ACP methyl ester carboxylesterase